MTEEQAAELTAPVWVAVAREHCGTTVVPCWPMAMNVRFTDEQTAALRERAAVEGRSMHQIITAAVEDYLLRRADDEDTARLAQEGAERFAELLTRLGE